PPAGFTRGPSTSKCLAQSNKSPQRGSAKRRAPPVTCPSEDHMNESIDLLHCHFGLTPSEARLALHLVTGETLRSAAAKLHIGYETARTQLKSIFSKTGTCRQAELVVVIVSACPGLLYAAAGSAGSRDCLPSSVEGRNANSPATPETQ